MESLLNVRFCEFPFKTHLYKCLLYFDQPSPTSCRSLFAKGGVPFRGEANLRTIHLYLSHNSIKLKHFSRQDVNADITAEIWYEFCNSFRSRYRRRFFLLEIRSFSRRPPKFDDRFSSKTSLGWLQSFNDWYIVFVCLSTCNKRLVHELRRNVLSILRVDAL